MLPISLKVSIPFSEIELNATRSQGAGGQNVNKVSTAIHLRFNIQASSLPYLYKQKLLNLRDKRITKEGVIVIKAQQHRTQEKNRQAALVRLQELIRSVNIPVKKRIATRPTLGSKKRRLDGKNKRSTIKKNRSKVFE